MTPSQAEIVNTKQLIFSPPRLRQARMMADMSVRKLSEALGGAPSHTILNRYENGIAIPSRDFLIKLSEVLNVNVSFFYQNNDVGLYELVFPKRKMFPVHKIVPEEERAKLYISRYNALESLLGLAPSITRVRDRLHSTLSKDSLRKPDTVASFLRKEWEMGSQPIYSLRYFLEANGIKVFEAEVEHPTFDGGAAFLGKYPAVIVSSDIFRNTCARRSVLAREIFSLFLSDDNTPYMPDKTSVDLQDYANAFLMPENSFTETFGGKRKKLSYHELNHLKNYLGVPVKSILKRALTLDLLEPQTYLYYINSFLKKNPIPDDIDDDSQKKEQGERYFQLLNRAISMNLLNDTQVAEFLLPSVSHV